MPRRSGFAIGNCHGLVAAGDDPGRSFGANSHRQRLGCARFLEQGRAGGGRASEREQLFAARLSTVVFSLMAILLGLLMKGQNLVF
jgi:hypothetical protein